jgi:hypothetical protein
MQYRTLDALKDPIALLNIKGYRNPTLNKSTPVGDGDEHPITVHHRQVLVRLCLFKSRCFIRPSIVTDRDENSINVHLLSLYVPKQRTNIEGGGTAFSLVDLWLSPVLFSKFISISPTAKMETTQIDITQLSSTPRFSLRMSEYVSFYSNYYAF